MKTYLAPIDKIEKKWHIVDADGKVLGRLATEVASRLRGKHKPTYCTFMDNGDFVVVVNAEKIRLTGKKMEEKLYHHHPGFMGGLKTATAKEMMEKKPTEIIRLAVQGMLPKNSLGRAQLKKLKIYVGTEHPHAAQQPTILEL